MGIVDEYLNKIDEAMQSGESQASLHELVKEIDSVFRGTIDDIGKGLDLNKCRANAPGATTKYDSLGDLKKLKGKLRAYKEKQETENLKDPLAMAVGKIDFDIDRCRSAICAGEDAAADELMATLVSVYGNTIEGFACDLPGYSYTESNPLKALSLIAEKLEQHKVQLALEYGRDSGTSITVSNNSSSNSASYAEVTVTQVSQLIQSLPESTLSDNDKDKLRLLLLDLDEMRGKKKEEARPKLKSVLSWLADKSVDVAIAAMPYIVSFLQTLM